MIKFIHANNISPNDIHWYFLKILQRPNSRCKHRQWLMHFSNDICWKPCSKYSCQCIKWRPWQCVANKGDYVKKVLFFYFFKTENLLYPVVWPYSLYVLVSVCVRVFGRNIGITFGACSEFSREKNFCWEKEALFPIVNFFHIFSLFSSQLQSGLCPHKYWLECFFFFFFLS